MTNTLYKFFKSKKDLASIILIFITLCGFNCSLWAAEFRSDTSTAFLSVLFGGISSTFVGVMQGTPNMMGIVFQYFNGFVATVGTAILVYITTISVMQSAHSGKPMGEKWGSLFFPVRVTAGAAMLLPNAFGYNFAQVITMWFILSGVTGADNVWDQVMVQMRSNGQRAVIGPPKAHIGSMTSAAVHIGGSAAWTYIQPAIEFATCIGVMGASPEPAGSTATLNPTRIRFCDPKSSYYPTCEPLPIKITCSPRDCSGTFIRSWTTMDDDWRNLSSAYERCGMLDFDGLKLDPPIHTAFMQSMLSDVILPYAQAVRASFFPKMLGSAPGEPYDKLVAEGDEQLYQSLLNNLPDPIPVVMRIINTAVADQNAVNATKTFSGDDVIAKNIGWVAAGATYYGIISRGGNNSYIPQKSYQLVGWYVRRMIDDFTVKQPYDIFSDIDKLQDRRVFDWEADNYYKAGFSYSQNEAKAEVRAQFKPFGESQLMNYVKLPFGLQKVLRAVVEFPARVFQMVLDLILNTSDLFGYPEKVNITDESSIRNALSVDPLHGVALNGERLAQIVEGMMVGLVPASIGALALVAVSGAIPYNVGIGIAMAICALLMGLLYAVFFIMLIFYPIAIIMNVYVPLIPFLIYTTGVIGWLLLCVEAMAAAPIVALGLMQPNGADEILGSAETGLKLLINLMLRPVLMIVGLVAGIIIVRINLLFFSITINLLFASNLIPTTSFASVGAATFVYIGLITVIVHKSFNLINEVPNKVMTWIGASGSSVGGEQEFLQAAEKGTNEGGQIPAKMAEKGKAGFKAGWGSVAPAAPKAAPQPTAAELGSGGG